MMSFYQVFCLVLKVFIRILAFQLQRIEIQKSLLTKNCNKTHKIQEFFSEKWSNTMLDLLIGPGIIRIESFAWKKSWAMVMYIQLYCNIWHHWPTKIYLPKCSFYFFSLSTEISLFLSVFLLSHPNPLLLFPNLITFCAKILILSKF